MSHYLLEEELEEELKELKGFFYRAETRGRAQGTNCFILAHFVPNDDRIQLSRSVNNSEWLPDISN